jgi:hypothetical protein
VEIDKTTKKMWSSSIVFPLRAVGICALWLSLQRDAAREGGRDDLYLLLHSVKEIIIQFSAWHNDESISCHSFDPLNIRFHRYSMVHTSTVHPDHIIYKSPSFLLFFLKPLNCVLLIYVTRRERVTIAYTADQRQYINYIMPTLHLKS